MKDFNFEGSICLTYKCYHYFSTPSMQHFRILRQPCHSCKFPVEHKVVRRVHVSCKTSYECYNQKQLEYLGLTRIDAIDICIDRAGLNQVPWASSCTQTLVNFLYIC